MINHKRYIGQSIDIYKRWRQHKNELNNDTHRNEHLQNAWKIYKECSFRFFIVEECDVFDLNSREVYYINLFKVENRNYGYNIEPGGNSNKIIPNETRIKMSLAKSDYFGEKNSFYGKHHSEDTKKYLRELWDNSEWSNDMRRKMSENHADVSGENNPMYGKKHTAKSKENMSKNTQKLFNSDNPNAHSVYCVELNLYFGSIIEASRYVDISRNTLSLHLNGKSQSAGKHPITDEKLHWYYTDSIPSNLTIQND